MRFDNPSIDRIYDIFLSEKSKDRAEKLITILAITSFFIHLGVIILVDTGVITPGRNSDLLTNPIASIYTPFSFILIYEVYLLIYYLPKSVSNYISKQYEIITLILIRRIFKDLSNLELTDNWFSNSYNLQFTYDIISTIILFYLIYLFYKANPRAGIVIENFDVQSKKLKRFIRLKMSIALILVPLLIGLGFYSLGNWFAEHVYSLNEFVSTISDVNEVFYDEFFTVLILTDVLLLLFSFFNSDGYHKVIRNSGFIISTILIKLSFSAYGLLNNVLIIVAVLFGLSMLWIHNKFEVVYQAQQEEIKRKSDT